MKNVKFWTNTEYYLYKVSMLGFASSVIGYRNKQEAFSVYNESLKNIEFDSILDIGSGYGYLGEMLKGKNYLGVEEIREFVDLTNKKNIEVKQLTFNDKTKIGKFDLACLIHTCDVYIKKRLYTTKLMLEGALKNANIVVWVCFIEDYNYRERLGIYKYSIHTIYEMLVGFTKEFSVKVFDKERCAIILKE